MRKIFCDICGREIGKNEEYFKLTLTNASAPIPVDLINNDTCERCTNSIIHYIGTLKSTKPVDNDT